MNSLIPPFHFYRCLIIIVSALLSVIVLWASPLPNKTVKWGGASGKSLSDTGRNAKREPRRMLENSTVTFERNLEQVDESVQFFSRSQGYMLGLSPQSSVFTFAMPDSLTRYEEKVELVGANRQATASGIDEQKTKSNYLIGNDPSKWIKNVPTYGGVRFESVYPGIIAYSVASISFSMATAPVYSSDPTPGSNHYIGNAQVGGSFVSLPITIENTGDETLSITNAEITGINPGDFSITRRSFDLASGASRLLPVTCKPTASGPRVATLTITHNAVGSPAVYNLQCNGKVIAGTAPVYSSDPAAGSAISIGSALVSSSTTSTLTVSNTGDSALAINDMTISGTNAADFTVSPETFDIASGGSSQAVMITCTPSATGSRTATLTVTHNADGSPAVYTLECTGTESSSTAPLYSSDPAAGSTISLGNVTVGSSITSTVTVSNTGDATLLITDSTISGTNAADFTISLQTFDIASGGSSQAVTITCTPSATGSRTATLTVTHNGSDSPAVYTLTCTGTEEGESEKSVISNHGTAHAASKGLNHYLTNSGETYAPSQILTTSVAMSVSLSGTLVASSIETKGAVIPYSFGGQSVLASAELSTSLGGITVKVTDSAGTEFSVGLFSVSTTEINWLVPASVADGAASATFYYNGSEQFSQLFTIARISPGIFTTDRTGSGTPVAMLVRLKVDTTHTIESLPSSIGLGAKTDQVFLSLCGTGFRHNTGTVTATIGGQSVKVYYSGATATHPGLDQVNIAVPRSLIGKGEVSVVVSFSGIVANTSTVNIN